ncbi:hypothetical protein MKW92_052631 [Papaver armeniacum]|nr:hypothetical protein MKW92_052631 [Papaver armeniacum]
MIDAAKYADVAIIMVDASYGFEMETFEFRNLLQVHGFPKVIGVLTHLDKVSVDEISEAKQRLEDHFCTEICEGAKLFSFPGLEDGLYIMPEINDLGEMLSDAQFLPLSWRAKHPNMLVDSFKDVTPEIVHGDKQSNRILGLYGYLRGGKINKGTKVHVAGAGDFSLAGVTESYDLRPVGSFGNFDRLVEQSTGTYLRLDILDVPPEMVEKFDPHHPILVGVILPEEENFGYMQVKLKRHGWRMDLLMTGAPITVSAGWRRYQTTAIYAMENENGQHLNYTPEHKECLAVFWGPLAPPKTRIVAVMNNLNCLKNKEAFRIMAKGVVLDFNLDAQILLKVEKMGTLVDTGGKTARIKFAPKLKIDGFKFIGAPIQTKSGVRGKIDKVARDGLVECTFKDNVHMGDTFLFPLNLLFKPLEIGIDGSVEATISAVDAATATAAAAAATNLSTAVKDELAVSYEEVAPRWQKLDLRHDVVIFEGRPSLITLPNPLESAYSSVEWKPIKRRKFSV